MSRTHDHRNPGTSRLLSKALNQRIDSRVYQLELGRQFVVGLPKDMMASERSEVASVLRAIAHTIDSAQQVAA